MRPILSDSQPNTMKNGVPMQQRDRDQDLCGDRRHFQRLRQEEQRIELPAVPDHGFAGGGTEQREDRDLGIRPIAESFRQRRLEPLPSAFMRLEHRGFIQLEPDPDRHREQDCGEQERNAPAPVGERRFALAVRMPRTSSNAMNRPTVAVV